MKQYLDLLKRVSENGVLTKNRTGIDTISSFIEHMKIDISEYFPLLTTKKVHFKSIAIEVLWYLRGDTNIKFLKDNGVSIWDEWADQNGELGNSYGNMWRNFPVFFDLTDGHNTKEEILENIKSNSTDQIKQVIEQIKNNPTSRRHIVTAWHPGLIHKFNLPPCHCFFQFLVRDKELSCNLYIRSNDLFLGSPFNIASYALLTYMIAEVCDLKPKELGINIGDAHIYVNHLEQVKEQLSRKPLKLPKLKFKRKVSDIDDFKYEDFELINYQSYPAIKGDVAI